MLFIFKKNIFLTFASSIDTLDSLHCGENQSIQENIPFLDLTFEIT